MNKSTLIDKGKTTIHGSARLTMTEKAGGFIGLVCIVSSDQLDYFFVHVQMVVAWDNSIESNGSSHEMVQPNGL